MNRIEKDPLQKRLEIRNWVILAVLAAGSLPFSSERFSLGILCGGLISVINFHWLYYNILTIFAHHLERAGKAMLFRYFIRMAVTGVILFVVISRELVDVIGLLVGLSVVPMNIVLTVALFVAKKNCCEGVR